MVAAPQTASEDAYPFAAMFEAGEAVLIPCRVVRQATATEWGCAVVEDGWSRSKIAFTPGAVLHDCLRGVIEGPALSGAGKWRVLVENGLAGARVTLPTDRILSALMPMARAA